MLADLSGVPDQDLYRNTNGVYLKLANFRAIDPAHDSKGMSLGGAGDRVVWEQWAHRPEELRRLASAIVTALTNKSTTTDPLVDEEDYEAPEGRLLLKMHLRRERNSQIGRKKKKAARNAGMLFCSVCGFNPASLYGPSVDAAIECHHILPLSELPTTRVTRLSDLALICANCHRTIHAENLTLEGLRSQLRGQVEAANR
jgi:5-methylcytosine-specific restriction protein A